MPKRMKSLVLMQLNFAKFKQNFKQKRTIVVILLRLLLVGAVTAVIFFLLSLFQNIARIEVNPALLLFVVVVSQILSVIENTNILVSELYLSRDSAILFALPARHSEIFASKLVVFYIKEFVKNLYFVVPLLLAFGLFLKENGLYFANACLLTIALPLFPVLFGAILSIPVMFVKRAIKSHPIFQSVLYVGIFGAIFFALVKFIDALPKPLRILALYNSFIAGVEDFVFKFNGFALFYKNAVYTLFDFRVGADYLVVLLVILGLMCLCLALAMPAYFRTVSHFSERVSVKKHNFAKVKPQRTFASFLTKEFKLLLRTPGRLWSYLSFSTTFPFLIFLMNTIFVSINTSSMGNILVLGLNIIISLVLITASNSLTSVSLSAEGEEFAILKSAPSKTYLVAYAKIFVNFVFSTIGLIGGMIVLGIISNIEIFQILLLTFVLICINTAHIFWSFQIDIMHPAIGEFAVKGNSGNSKNIGTSLVAGIVIALVFGFLALFFFLDSIVGGWLRLVVLAIVFLIVRVVLFYINMKVLFKRIEV